MPREPVNEAAYQETKFILDLMNSPLIAENEVVSLLPEACMVSCEYDLLRDDSLSCKKRLGDRESQRLGTTWRVVSTECSTALTWVACTSPAP